jgi:hypothetical protein
MSCQDGHDGARGENHFDVGEDRRGCEDGCARQAVSVQFKNEFYAASPQLFDVLQSGLLQVFRRMNPGMTSTDVWFPKALIWACDVRIVLL